VTKTVFANPATVVFTRCVQNVNVCNVSREMRLNEVDAKYVVRGLCEPSSGHFPRRRRPHPPQRGVVPRHGLLRGAAGGVYGAKLPDREMGVLSEGTAAFVGTASWTKLNTSAI
jgi:hypothetical protein